METRLPILLIALASGFIATTAQAQDVVPGLPASCVSPFWDAQTYGWAAFRNNCGQPIHLQFVAKNQTGPFGHGGSANIAAGASANIGQSRSEVNEAGGYSYYVCPRGYIAEDRPNHQVDSPDVDYSCRRSY